MESSAAGWMTAADLAMLELSIRRRISGHPCGKRLVIQVCLCRFHPLFPVTQEVIGVVNSVGSLK
jgi:hypothetical protein